MSMACYSTAAAQGFLEGIQRAVELLADLDGRWGSSTENHRKALVADMVAWKARFERENRLQLDMPKGWLQEVSA